MEMDFPPDTSELSAPILERYYLVTTEAREPKQFTTRQSAEKALDFLIKHRLCWWSTKRTANGRYVSRSPIEETMWSWIEDQAGNIVS